MNMLALIMRDFFLPPFPPALLALSIGLSFPTGFFDIPDKGRKNFAGRLIAFPSKKKKRLNYCTVQSRAHAISFVRLEK